MAGSLDLFFVCKNLFLLWVLFLLSVHLSAFCVILFSWIFLVPLPSLYVYCYRYSWDLFACLSSRHSVNFQMISMKPTNFSLLLFVWFAHCWLPFSSFFVFRDAHYVLHFFGTHFNTQRLTTQLLIAIGAFSLFLSWVPLISIWSSSVYNHYFVFSS